MAMADDVQPQQGRSEPSTTAHNNNNHMQNPRLGPNFQINETSIRRDTTTEDSPYTIPLASFLSSQDAVEPIVRMRQNRQRKKQNARVCFPRLTPCALSRVVVRTDRPDKYYASSDVCDAKLVTWDEYLQAKQDRKNRRRRDSLAAHRHTRAGTIGVAQQQGKPIAVQTRTKKKRKKKKKQKRDSNVSRISSDGGQQRINAISATSSMDPTPLMIPSRESSSAGGSASSGVYVTRWESRPIVVSPLNDTNDTDFAATAWPPIAMLGGEEDEDEEDDEGDSIRAAELVAGAGAYSENSFGLTRNNLASTGIPWGLEPGESLARTAASHLSLTPRGTSRPRTHH